MNDTSIEKKAYFGRRDLKRIQIPESVREVGDWAFASCRNLEEVEFAGEEVTLGKAVFQKCGKLRKIHVKEKHPDVAYLLAAVPVRLGESSLMHLAQAGSKAWLERFDALLLACLNENEMEGFAGHFVCGEEDSGRKNEDDYREERRREKAELAYLRLLHPLGIELETEGKLRAFLLGHRKGCASEAAWKTLLDNHGMDMEYAALYMSISKNAPESFDRDAHIKEIGEEYPELRAFFLKDGTEEAGSKEFFDALNLDF